MIRLITDHPFFFPDFRHSKHTKDEIIVQFEFLQVFASKSIRKEFYLKKFLDNFSSSLNGSRKHKIKKYLIELALLFETNNLIEPNYKIITGGQEIKTHQLTTRNINQGFIFYEVINY